MNQWFPIIPDASVTEPIPPFALCKRKGVSEDTVIVSRPDAPDDYEVIVNGEASVNPDVDDVIGKGTYGRVVNAAYDPDADDVPAVGEEWGSGVGSWFLTKGRKGFRIIGEPSAGVATCLRIPFAPVTSWKLPVHYATTAALPANTYNNGTLGVGATLTANANGFFTVDSAGQTLNNRLLVKNEANQAYNGIYVVTQLGDSTHPFILTRATDADKPEELAGAVVAVLKGVANQDSVWMTTADDPTPIGSSVIPWVKLYPPAVFNSTAKVTASSSWIVTGGVQTQPSGFGTWVSNTVALDTAGIQYLAAPLDDTGFFTFAPNAPALVFPPVSVGGIPRSAVLPLQSADATHAGFVNTAAGGQTFGGPKTFTHAVTMNTTLDAKGAVTVGLVATQAPLVVHGSGAFDADVRVGIWGVDTQSIYASGDIEAYRDLTSYRNLNTGGGAFIVGQGGSGPTQCNMQVYIGGPGGAFVGDPNAIRLYRMNNGHPTHSFEGWGWITVDVYRSIRLGYNAFTEHDHWAASRVGSVWNSAPTKYPLDITDSVAAAWLSCGNVGWGTSGMTAPAYGPPNYPATQPIQASSGGPGMPGIEFQTMVDPATNPAGLFNVVRGSLGMRYDGAFDFSTMHTAADPNTAGWVAAKGFWANGLQGKSGTGIGTFTNGVCTGVTASPPAPPAPPPPPPPPFTAGSLP